MVGCRAPRKALVRDLMEGICQGWCLGEASLQREPNLRQHLVWGLLSDYGVGYSVNDGDIYLPFLGNYCKLRNPEGAVPERGICQALLGMGNGAMSAGDTLAWLSVFGFSSIPQPRPQSTSPFASLSLFACHFTYLHLLCGFWQIVSLL